MPKNAVAENVLGTIGTVFWAFQLVPQIIKSYRRKGTEGLSTWALLLWVVGSIPQGTYLVVQNFNIPLIVQPQLFSFFAIIAMAQCWHYAHRRSTKLCLLAGVATGLVAGGLEVGFYFLCKLGEHRGTPAGTKTMGIAGAVLIVVGLLPQYYEIWKFKEVRGISFVFLAIDCMGGVFSLLSLVFKEHFDGIAAANYLGIVVLELGIFALICILNPRARKRREREAAEHSDAETDGRVAEQRHAGSDVSSAVVAKREKERQAETPASALTISDA
ncbi:hypothetical protein ACQY0O_002510 [Thecaphora frezii]